MNQIFPRLVGKKYVVRMFGKEYEIVIPQPEAKEIKEVKKTKKTKK